MTAPLASTPVVIEGVDSEAINRMLVDALQRISAQVRFNLSPEDHTDVENNEWQVRLMVDGEPYDFKLYHIALSEKGFGSIVLEAPESELSPGPESFLSRTIFVALTALYPSAPDLTCGEYTGIQWAQSPKAFVIDMPYQTDPDDKLLDMFYHQDKGELLTLFGV